MKKIFIGLFLAFALISCTERERHQMNVDNAWYDTDRLIYTKDRRTNLCYAHSYPRSNWGTMANVPCSPEVEKLIKE